jgi:hypothetical protein
MKQKSAEQVSIAARLQILIRKVNGSNLSQGTDILTASFVVFLSPSSEIPAVHLETGHGQILLTHYLLITSSHVRIVTFTVETMSLNDPYYMARVS